MTRLVLLLPFLLAACSSAPPPPAEPRPTPRDSQLEAIDQARSTRATLEQGKQKTDQALQKAEGGE